MVFSLIIVFQLFVFCANYIPLEIIHYINNFLYILLPLEQIFILNSLIILFPYLEHIKILMCSKLIHQASKHFFFSCVIYINFCTLSRHWVKFLSLNLHKHIYIYWKPNNVHITLINFESISLIHHKYLKTLWCR